MAEVADIFQRYGPAYRENFGERMPAIHRKIMATIESCRTEALGGHLYYCDACDKTHHSYHSCRNRHCPKCQNDAAQEWLMKQQTFLLPIPYFMVTFTLPAELRNIARSNSQVIYNILFRTSAAALQELAGDNRFVGGKIGMVGVLQTWTRDLNYHPHVHYLATGGGLSADGKKWHPSRKNFLVHAQPLSILFRAKFRDALLKTDLFGQVPAKVWSQEWVADCRPVGSGASALKYLAPYIFRVAISNNRILKVENDSVTFSYKESGSHKMKRCTLKSEEFIRRFLQHVLPKGFVKVRYYGLLSPGNRPRLLQAQQLLGHGDDNSSQPSTPEPSYSEKQGEEHSTSEREVCCPACGQVMRCVQTIRPRSRCPPSAA